MPIKVLAVDDNIVNLRVVTATLARGGYQIETAENGLEALSKVESFKPDLVILDISMPNMDGYEVCRRLRSIPAHAHLPIIMLTAHDTLDEKIKGFEAGADDYLVKPFQPAELEARIKVLSRRSIPALPEGKGEIKSKVITVYSLRGGAGASSVATNLAVILNELWQKPVALVDLALVNGQSALMLNLPLRNTWSDLAKSPAIELDVEQIEMAMLEHESGLHVLASPRNPGDAEFVTKEHVERVLEVLSQHYEYIVLDLPHDLNKTTLAGISFTDEFLLMMTPELASVKTMAGLLEVFDRFEIPRSQSHIVLNWIFKSNGLAKKNIEAALNQPIEFVIPYAGDLFISAINLGIPLSPKGNAEPIRTVIEDVAYQFSKLEHKEEKPTKPSETLQRLWKRFPAEKNSRK